MEAEQYRGSKRMRRKDEGTERCRQWEPKLSGGRGSAVYGAVGNPESVILNYTFQNNQQRP